MAAIKLGIHVDHLRLPPRQGLRQAARLGFTGVQLDATRGVIRPDHLSRSGRRDLHHTVRGLGLEFSSLAADTGGKRLADPRSADQRIDLTKRIMELARELRIPVVTTAVGRFSDRPDDPARQLVQQALRELGDHADRTGTFLAVETAEADPGGIAALLRELDCPALRVSYDPAAVIMAGLNPLKGIEPLADQIVTAQLHDAVRPTAAGAREVPLGQGELPLEEFLATLDEAGYRGYHVLQRREGHDPAADLQAAKALLERL